MVVTPKAHLSTSLGFHFQANSRPRKLLHLIMPHVPLSSSAHRGISSTTLGSFELHRQKISNSKGVNSEPGALSLIIQNYKNCSVFDEFWWKFCWMVACLLISLGKSSSSLLNKEMMKTSQRVIMASQLLLHNYNIKWLRGRHSNEVRNWG